MFRPVSSGTGSLCGLASLYQALENTLLTKSELSLLTYSSMRGVLAKEMSSNATLTAGLTDTALLSKFYECE